MVSKELALAIPSSVFVYRESDGSHTRHRDYTGLGTWCPTSSLKLLLSVFVCLVTGAAACSYALEYRRLDLDWEVHTPPYIVRGVGL